jgi:hypothetical protein
MSDTGASEQWVPFVYRDFYDLPRMLVFMADGRCYLFDCVFDQEADEYSPDYQVWELPVASLSDLPAGSWADVLRRALRRLGSLPVKSLRLDETRRRFVDASVLLELLQAGEGEAPLARPGA